MYLFRAESTNARCWFQMFLEFSSRTLGEDEPPILTVRIFFKWAGKNHHNSWGLIEAFPMTASWGWNVILQGNYTTGSSDAEVCVFQKREVSMYQGVLDSKVASVWESQLSVLRDKKNLGFFFWCERIWSDLGTKNPEPYPPEV